MISVPRPRSTEVSPGSGDKKPPSAVKTRRRVVRVSKRTPSRSSMRVTNLESAEGVTPRSPAAAAKLLTLYDTYKAFISAEALFMNLFTSEVKL